MIIIPMGVSGSGKTTIGKLLAARLGKDFCDADDLHPAANLQKMANGIPLNDEDRQPWLQAVRRFMVDRTEEGKDAVIACSALREEYRDYLSKGLATRFVYLKGSYDLIRDRLSRREGHFMKPAMLESQFDTLEEPDNCLIVDISLSPEKIVDDIIADLMLPTVQQS